MTAPDQTAYLTDFEAEFLTHLQQRNQQLSVDPCNQLDSQGSPSVDELTGSLAFAPNDGNIWLSGQRMMLMQSEVFGSLRYELIERLGIEQARQLLSRLGWQAGARDAASVSKLWPGGDDASLFAAGPRLHMIKGMVQVELTHLEIDNSRGHFYAEFAWHNSIESNEQISRYGVGSENACWMQVGYASGYASTLLGRQVVFRETECRACGHKSCQIIGKPAEQWDNVEQDLAYLEAGDLGPYQRIQPLADGDSEKTMVGASPAFIAATQLASRVAATDATVLLTGESGVGKELFARTLHLHSKRSETPLVALNCATLPENLIEAELFGVEKGAYTGADRTRAGRFERADGGTLFLDEIGILSPSAQGKLLRVLQEGEVDRLGSSAPIKVDVRVIAATNVDLAEEVAAGRFREDLYYRLNVFPIHLPPLRERREDIPLLMNHFLHTFCKRHDRQLTGFTMRLVNTMLTYRFPGNIRELQNLIERGVIIARDGEALDINHLAMGAAPQTGSSFTAPVGLNASGGIDVLQRPAPATPAPSDSDVAAPEPTAAAKQPSSRVLASLQAFISGRQQALDTSLAEIEELLIRQALDNSGGNITAAAQMLGMSRAQVSYRLKDR